MIEPELSDDSTVSDLPWAAVFDAAANVRALGAVQAQGFRAASRLVDRFVKTSNGTAETGPGAATEPADIRQDSGHQDSEHQSEWRPTVDRVIGGWEALATQLTRSLSNSTTAHKPGPVFDVGGAEATGIASLSHGAEGVESAEVWLHNGGAQDLGEVRLRCSDLLAHDGALVGATAVRFDPAVVQLPARSSRGVVISVEVLPQTRPGVYRGTLLVDGHPDIWMPIELSLRSPAHDR